MLKPKLPKVPSEPEATFLQCWKAIGGKAPVTEMQFHQDRKWRWDFAWPEVRLAIEIQGGIWAKGGHSSGKGITRDCEKFGAAAILKWHVIPMTPDQITPAYLEEIREAFGL